MITVAFSRMVESLEESALLRYVRAESRRSANALRDARSAAVSLLSLLACAVSYTAPSTTVLAMRSALLMSDGTSARGCLYSHSELSLCPRMAHASPSGLQHT